MRISFFTLLVALMILAGCKKASGPVNFVCTVDGTSKLQGTAVTFYNSTVGTFQVIMNGPNGESTALNWYGIDSIQGEKSISARTYTIPAIALPPLTLTGTFSSPNTGPVYVYTTGNGNNLGGTITITQNTGPGGLISGTYSFNAINTTSGAYDTVYITQGSFTNVAVVSQ